MEKRDKYKQRFNKISIDKFLEFKRHNFFFKFSDDVDNLSRKLTNFSLAFYLVHR